MQVKMPAATQRVIHLYKRYVTYTTATPVIITVAIIVISLAIAMVSSRNLASVQAQAIGKQLKENQLLVQSNFQSYSQMVLSGVGRLNSGPINRQQWQQFVDTYKLQQNFPAITSMSVTRYLRPADQQPYVQLLSQDYNRPITVIKGDAAQDVNILAYVSPENDRTPTNVGFNLYSDVMRRQTMQAATDISSIAITDQLQLFVDARQSSLSDGAAFLMYAPYYAGSVPPETIEQRRAAILGHVAVAFRTSEVFRQLLNKIDQEHVSAEVAMGRSGSEQVVYRTAATGPSGPRIQRQQNMTIFGQSIKVSYEFDSNFLVSPTQLHAPLTIGVFGSFIALLVGTITLFFLRSRHHRLLLDQEREVARAKDELLSLASHQLRTPATGVKQYIGMVLQGFVGKLTPVQEELLDKAYKSNERQLRTINDILHLAKLDLGRIALAKSHFNLTSLVRDVVDEQLQDIDAGKLGLRLNLLKTAPLYADEHMLRMVIENIISNAVKYTEPGGKIWVRLQHKNGGYVIEVKDTGVGIAEHDMPLLFQKFSRLLNSRSHVVSGTGVGLYLAYHLIEMHKGTISVESAPGKGSTFSIFIPSI